MPKGNDSKASKKPNTNPNTNATANTTSSNKDNKKKRFVRMAGGQKWEDDTLNEWDPGKDSIIWSFGLFKL
jgi:hypothetical protein